MKNLADKSYKYGIKENQRIVYKCKDCGWQTSILASWADLKPKKCMGKKCKTSFLQSPDKLLVEKPVASKPVEIEEKCEECDDDCPEECSEKCESKKKSKKNKKK